MYKVTASGEHFATETYEFDASNSLEATTHAIGEILNRAHGEHNVWARGRIELADEHGTVLHVMEEKGEEAS